jgi:hypothetical protein
MTVTDLLEERARGIRDRYVEPERATPLSLLERDIAFSCEQLERLRTSVQDQLLRILRNEATIGTDLLNLDASASAAFRDHLKTRIAHLDVERRQVLATYERNLAILRERLLQLLGQHAHLRS